MHLFAVARLFPSACIPIDHITSNMSVVTCFNVICTKVCLFPGVTRSLRFSIGWSPAEVVVQ